MELQIRYMELAELFLFLRQAWSGERFHPFNSAMASAMENLTESRLDTINYLGILTNGYLSALRALIDDPDMEPVDPAGDPSLLFLDRSDPVSDERVAESSAALLEEYSGSPQSADRCGELLRDLWRDLICREKAARAGGIFDKIAALRRDLASEDPFAALASISDRFSLEGEELVFRISPELRMKKSGISRLTVVPSLFASRDLTFWYSGTRLLFFVSLEDRKGSAAEPSDMDLLCTSALNDRTRLKMLRYIAGGSCTAGDLAGFLQMNPSTVSRHLKIFKDAGFVNIHSGEGKAITYSISGAGIDGAFARLKAYLLEDEEK